MIITVIDPGKQTGFAVFEDGTYVFSTTMKECFPHTVISRMCHVEYVFQDHHEHQAVIEVPDSWTRDGKNVKSLLSVQAIAYTLYGWLTSQGQHCFMIPVSQWKGSTPKTLTLAEVSLIFKAQGISPDHPLSTHEVDAIRLGLWAQGQTIFHRKLLNGGGDF